MLVTSTSFRVVCTRDVKSVSCRRLFSVYATRRKDVSHQGLKKLYNSADEAVADIQDGATLLSGGFGLCGTPDTLIKALSRRKDVGNLTAVSNNAGVDKDGLGALLHSGQVTKMIASYIGGNKHFESLYLTGGIALELCPQGTLAERCRAGGAGIPAFYTPAGVGTAFETGEIPEQYQKDENGKLVVKTKGRKRETREFNGKKFLLEPAIRGDVAFVKAWKADEYGNCQFRYTANNFNSVMARAARVTIVEAEEIVKPGELDPNFVHLPSIYVNRLIQSTAPKLIENETTSDIDADEAVLGKGSAKDRRRRIAKRAAQELKDGMYVNLGIGMPMLAPSFLDPKDTIHIQSENGILGMGPYPARKDLDPDMINAGKETVTFRDGASIFDSSESFAMIRGGHIDVSMLGAMQVSANGDLANYMIPGKLVKGPGGAIDLVANPDQTKIVVVMDHVAKGDAHKILPECTLPLTGSGCVDTIITDLCVFKVDRQNGGLTLIELASGVTEDEVRQKTGAPFKVAADVKQMIE